MIPLAQADTFSDIFWMSIGLIFLAAIIGAVFAHRRRDRCLKLMDDYHVTLQTTTGRTIWGDVHVFAKGVEVVYDAPYRTRVGLIKNSYLMYDDELANLLAVSRYVGGLTDAERRRRDRQVKVRFEPSTLRRFGRWLKNMFNTVRDAGNKALTAIVGQFAKAHPGTAISAGTGEVNQIGQTIITGVGDAYEPMLERHIGTAIVLEMASPTDPAKRNVELPGYLAEYSDRFVAVFNVEQPVRERFEIEVDGTVQRDDLSITADAVAVTVSNKVDQPLVVESVVGVDGKPQRLSIVLNHGASARLSRLDGAMTVTLLRVAQIDVVCPRQYARVRHASDLDIGPPAEGEAKALPPAHEDQTVQFP